MNLTYALALHRIGVQIDQIMQIMRERHKNVYQTDVYAIVNQKLRVLRAKQPPLLDSGKEPSLFESVKECIDQMLKEQADKGGK